METLKLTKQDILNDIKVYQARLDRLKDRLGELPAKGGTWQERKKIKATKAKLKSEVPLLETTIGYAQDALKEMEAV